MKYVIIGSGIAACGAVEGIRSTDLCGDITIIDGEKRGAYTRPLISYFLSDPDRYRDIDYRSLEFFGEQQVEIIPARAKQIDRSDQIISLDNGQQIEYDRLLIATGSCPLSPPIPGAEQDWVSTFYTIEDAELIVGQAAQIREVVVIGSGLIGMKAAEALHKRGMYVHMVEKEAHILPRQLTPRTAEFLNEHLSSSGWDIITGEEVTVIHPQHKVELKSGRMLSADLVILAVGTRPAVELARQSELDVRTGIVVDAYFQTSDPKIYAAGDVAETLNLASQQLEVMALLPHAHREGYLAGCNMAGQSKPDPGSILMNSVRLLDWNICSAGAADYRGGELLTWQYQEQLLELKIRDNRLIRYIAINVPEAAGPLTNSVSRKMAISAASWKEFLADGPQLLNIPPVYWQELRRAEAYGSN